MDTARLLAVAVAPVHDLFFMSPRSPNSKASCLSWAWWSSSSMTIALAGMEAEDWCWCDWDGSWRWGISNPLVEDSGGDTGDLPSEKPDAHLMKPDWVGVAEDPRGERGAPGGGKKGV